jgi:molybdopterin converting factor small subunit
MTDKQVAEPDSQSVKAESFSPEAAAPAQGLLENWVLSGLQPGPEQAWDQLKEFLDLNAGDREAMLATVEALFRRGYELVVANYAYLQEHHGTAVILGWEKGADPAHLAERRRFFTVWLARTLGMDLGHAFARYLFRAGQIHAGHGPRHIHVPEVYVTGAVSLVNATFARFLAEEMPGSEVVPAALAGWNKVLSLHLHMMLLGYQSALELERGDFSVPVHFFGRLRALTGAHMLTMHLPEGSPAAAALRKLFDYYPGLRPEVFETAWVADERLDHRGAPWLEVQRGYRVRSGWRVLLNGRDLNYEGGPEAALHPGDTLEVFPPGR